MSIAPNALLNWKGHAWLSLAARFYLGYIFIYACIHKIAHPAIFALDIATYEILPLPLINITAITLPWLELVVGIFLIIGWKSRPAALLVAAMMAVFTLAIIIALSKGLDMSCGCFASQAANKDDPISKMTVLRDVIWLSLALYVAFFDREPIGIEKLRPSSRKTHV